MNNIHYGSAVSGAALQYSAMCVTQFIVLLLHALPPAGLAAIVEHFIFLMLNILVTWLLRYPEMERKAIIIMASQKNLPTAAVIISYFDQAAVGNLGLITIPCIVFYIMQVSSDGATCLLIELPAVGLSAVWVVQYAAHAWSRIGLYSAESELGCGVCFRTVIRNTSCQLSMCVKDAGKLHEWQTLKLVGQTICCNTATDLPQFLARRPQLFIDAFIANTWSSKYERIQALENKYEEQLAALEHSDDGHGHADLAALAAAAAAATKLPDKLASHGSHGSHDDGAGGHGGNGLIGAGLLLQGGSPQKRGMARLARDSDDGEGDGMGLLQNVELNDVNPLVQRGEEEELR